MAVKHFNRLNDMNLLAVSELYIRSLADNRVHIDRRYSLALRMFIENSSESSEHMIKTGHIFPRREAGSGATRLPLREAGSSVSLLSRATRMQASSVLSLDIRSRAYNQLNALPGNVIAMTTKINSFGEPKVDTLSPPGYPQSFHRHGHRHKDCRRWTSSCTLPHSPEAS